MLREEQVQNRSLFTDTAEAQPERTQEPFDAQLSQQKISHNPEAPPDYRRPEE
jgi:hypothetical protein